MTSFRSAYHFGFHHPELGQVAARLGLLRAERRAETIRPAQRHRVRFVVELSALREIGRGVFNLCTGNRVVVPSQADGVKMGPSARMNPRLLK